MTTETTEEFFQALGFEEIEIEDKLTSLFIETDPDESYALLTDDEGLLPISLRKPLVFACYSPDGAFRWNVGIKNAYLFKELWEQHADISAKLDALRLYREQNETF